MPTVSSLGPRLLWMCSAKLNQCGHKIASIFYQTGYYHGDNGLLASCTITKASSFLFADTLLFPRKHRSLILGYFAASVRDFKFILQLLEASVTDKVLVV